MFLPQFDRVQPSTYNCFLMQTRTVVEPIEQARLVVDFAEEKLASDIVLLNLVGVCDFADYFVIMTGVADRHIQSLAEEIVQALEGGERSCITERGPPPGAGSSSTSATWSFTCFGPTSGSSTTWREPGHGAPLPSGSSEPQVRRPSAVILLRSSEQGTAAL